MNDEGSAVEGRIRVLTGEARAETVTPSVELIQSRGRQRATRRRWIVATAAAVLVVGALGAFAGLQLTADTTDRVDAGPAQGVETPGEAASDEAVLQPGDAIAEGFVVADATVVPGGAFPTRGWTYDGMPTQRTWSAVVESDRELPEVIAAYANQAKALGYSLPGFDTTVDPEVVATEACEVTLAQDNSDVVGATSQPRPGTPLFDECRVDASRVVDGRRENVAIGGGRTYPAAGEWPMDYILLSFSQSLPNEGTGLPPSASDSQEPTMVKPMPGSGPPPSSVPDPIDGEPLIVCASSARIEPGSRLLGAGFDCAGVPYSYIVTEVMDDPEAVFDAYVQQINDATGYNPPVKVEKPSKFDGRNVYTAAIWGDDSSMLRVTMLTGGDRPAILIITSLSG